MAANEKDIKYRAMENMHNTLIEALRHREQDILRFLTILAPSLGGFIWLLNQKDINVKTFIAAILGILLFLLTGAVYSVALGYNFRYITFQLAKLESDLGLKIKDCILTHWLQTPEKCKNRPQYCTPPEIIKVFWLAFITTEIFITVASGLFLWKNHGNICIVVVLGLLCIAITLIAPVYYGCKLHKVYSKENDTW